jgi:hypothetical protein
MLLPKRRVSQSLEALNPEAFFNVLGINIWDGIHFQKSPALSTLKVKFAGESLLFTILCSSLA